MFKKTTAPVAVHIDYSQKLSQTGRQEIPLKHHDLRHLCKPLNAARYLGDLQSANARLWELWIQSEDHKASSNREKKLIEKLTGDWMNDSDSSFSIATILRTRNSRLNPLYVRVLTMVRVHRP